MWLVLDSRSGLVGQTRIRDDTRQSLGHRATIIDDLHLKELSCRTAVLSIAPRLCRQFTIRPVRYCARKPQAPYHVSNTAVRRPGPEC